MAPMPVGVGGMVMKKRPPNRGQLLTLAFYCIAIFLSSTVLALLCTVDGPSYLDLPTGIAAVNTITEIGAAAPPNLTSQISPIDEEMKVQKVEDLGGSLGRRFLSGPGSAPPLCTSKCAKCTPCTPVHIPVQPGTPKPAEYYPEAWRCKCHNRLYMP